MPTSSSPGVGARPKVAVIDYGMGNLRSVLKAWEHAGSDARLIDRPDQLQPDDVLVFPGQGAIVDTMKLLQRTGFDHVVRDWIGKDRPFFGICLGLQALFEHSEEGDTRGLGVFHGHVRRFRFPSGSALKVPHMGWNTVRFAEGGPGPVAVADGSASHFYFVHSYYVETPESDLVWGETVYGEKKFVSAIRRGRCVATQFHPEKSQQGGLALYARFLDSL